MSERFTAAKKLAVIQAVKDAPENTDAILASRDISHEEFDEWLRFYGIAGFRGLRVTRMQELRRGAA